MSIEPRRDAYLDPYRRSHRRHGPGFAVTCWSSPDSQRRRFEVFLEMCDLRGRRILDGGCSRGDLAAFLLEEEVGFARYVGVDALPEVIDHARRRGLPRCEFHAGDLLADPSLLRLGRPEAVCLSGTLNTMADDQAWRLLEAAWEATSEFLLFNFLSDRCGPGAPPQGGGCRRLPAMELLRWATGRTWHVEFRQDYFEHGHDGTIAMRKVGRGLG